MPQLQIPLTRQGISRRMIAVAITFVMACALALVVLESRLGGPEGLRVLRVGLAALGLACLAAGLASAIVTILLNRRVRESAHGDVWLLRRLERVVLEAKHQELRTAEQGEALVYAAVMSVVLPFQLSYVALVFVGVCLELVQLMLTAGATTAMIVPGAASALVGVSAVISQRRRLKRARHYVRENSELLTGPGCVPPS